MKGVANMKQRPRIYLRRRVEDGLNNICGNGISQSMLAHVIGVSIYVIINMMSGESISKGSAAKLAQAMSGEKATLTWEDITEVRYV